MIESLGPLKYRKPEERKQGANGCGNDPAPQIPLAGQPEGVSQILNHLGGWSGTRGR